MFVTLPSLCGFKPMGVCLDLSQTERGMIFKVFAGDASAADSGVPGAAGVAAFSAQELCIKQAERMIGKIDNLDFILDDRIGRKELT